MPSRFPNKIQDYLIAESKSLKIGQEVESRDGGVNYTKKTGRKRLKTKYICSCGQYNPMFIPLFLSSGMVYPLPGSIHNTHTIFPGYHILNHSTFK